MADQLIELKLNINTYTTAIFPDQIVSEILTHLPAKTVCRFKTVSKRWYAIICNSHFLFSYISRNTNPPGTTWVKLDRIIAESTTESTRFNSSKYSNIHILSVNPTRLLKPDEPISDPDRYPMASIMQSSGGLLLFAISVTPEDPFKDGLEGFAKLPWRPHFERIGNQPTIVINKDTTHDALFVTNPVTNDLTRLPTPPRSFLTRHNHGFTTRVTPVEASLVAEFVVAVYEPNALHDEDTDDATLTCFSSETGEWVVKTAAYPLGQERVWEAHFGFEFKGRLFWTDLSVGMITWDDDPFLGAKTDEFAACSFIPIPSGRAVARITEKGMGMRSIDPVAGEFIQYTEMTNDGAAVGLYVWRLEGCNCDGKASEDDWELVYEVSKSVIETSLGCVLNQVPNVNFVDPFDGDNVVLSTTEIVFSFNVRTRVVKDRGSVFGHSVYGHSLLMPFVCPCWPASLPENLCEDPENEKEKGNVHFKARNFTKAITCYSRSIALLPTTAAYGNRAMAYLKLELFREAEDDCTKALELDGKFHRAYGRRALARKGLGNLEGALKDAVFALTLEPHSQQMEKIVAEIQSLLKEDA